MRAVDIRIKKVSGGFTMLRDCFRNNLKFYSQEALGLGIFMVSACFFSGVLFGENGYLVTILPANYRQILLGMMMGLTALYIFYSPLTNPSGSHINPAVTLSFFRLGKIGFLDTIFYIAFQFAGATLTVYLMAALMKENLSNAPVYDVVTVPGKYGTTAAAFTELLIAFIMMGMVLFTADHRVLKKYSRIFAAMLVCLFVIVAGPVSGFGMNPARSFASALPANIWTSFWIYLFMPLIGMLGATEFYIFVRRRKSGDS